MIEIPAFAGLTAKHCRAAWQITQAAFNAAYGLGLTNKLEMSVAVIRPEGNTSPADFNGLTTEQLIGFGLTEDEIAKILYIDWFGRDPNPKYTLLAAKKGLLSARTGMPSGDVITNAPWLLLPGDVKYRGGVYEDGQAVGASGVQSNWDEFYSWTQLSAQQAITREETLVLAADDSQLFVPVR